MYGYYAWRPYVPVATKLANAKKFAEKKLKGKAKGIIRLITQLVFCRQCSLLFSILPNPHSHLATSVFHGIFR